MPKLQYTNSTLYCSFCGKSQYEIKKLIAGPTVFICDECVDVCKDIVAEDNAERELHKRLKESGERIASKHEVEALAWMRTWTMSAPTKTGGV